MPTLEEIMRRANRSSVKVAHVDPDGLVRQIQHVQGPVAMRPDVLAPADATHEVVELAEDDYAAMIADAHSDNPRGFRYDRAAKRLSHRQPWAPGGLPPTTVMGRAEVIRLTAPAAVTLTWDGLPALQIRLNEIEETIDSPFTLQMNQPGQYEMAVVDPRVAYDFFRFVITKGGPP